MLLKESVAESCSTRKQSAPLINLLAYEELQISSSDWSLNSPTSKECRGDCNNLSEGRKALYFDEYVGGFDDLCIFFPIAHLCYFRVGTGWD